MTRRENAADPRCCEVGVYRINNARGSLANQTSTTATLRRLRQGYPSRVIPPSGLFLFTATLAHLGVAKMMRATRATSSGLGGLLGSPQQLIPQQTELPFSGNAQIGAPSIHLESVHP